MVIYKQDIIEVMWVINGVDGYGFGSDKKLYNLKTSHEIKMTIKGYTKGYQIKNKFYTLNKLRTLSKRPERFNLPF